MSVSFSAMNPALRLISTFDGSVKVHIDDSKFAGIADTPLAGCTSASIKSVSLFVKQAEKPFNFWSNTLNGNECTYFDDQGVLRIVSEVAIASKLASPASYAATLTLNYGTSSTKTITGTFTVVGDMITPVIVDVSQGSAVGTTLKLKITPNSFMGLSSLITSNLSKVIIVKDGAMLDEVSYRNDGVYEITGLILNQEYSFAAIMKSSEGYMSEISATVKGTPVNTPDVGTAPTGKSGFSGDYLITITSQTRGALAAGATDAEHARDQLTQLDVYAYEHAADDLLVATVPESMYRKIGTVNAVVNADKSSIIPDAQLRIEGAFNGRFVRYFARASNGHGQGKSKEGIAFSVVGAPKAAAVSCSLLSDHNYEIAVQPGAAVAGYTLIGHKVEVKARSANNWATSVGTFSELTGAKDTWSIANGIAHLRAIDKVTSSGVTGKSDVVSHKAVSKVNFKLTTVGAFDVRVTSIYELTRELTQVALGSVVLGSDLRTAAGPDGSSSTQKLVYGLANTVFADAGFTAAVAENLTADPPVQAAAAIVGNILVGDATSEALLENVIPVTSISEATWNPVAAAKFESASGAGATYSMSMAKFTLSSLSENGVAYTYDTHTVKYSIMKKGIYPQYSEIALLDGASFDPNTLKQFFIIPRGEKSEVGVQVSVYKLGKLVAQSALSALITLIPSGQGAYSGLAVMTHADQGVVDYPQAVEVGADVKSVLNRTAADVTTNAATATTCHARIAMEGSADASEDARMNHPAFLAAGWVRDTKIYKLDEVTGLETGNNLAGTAAPKTFNELNKPERSFLVHTLTGLEAMKSHSFTVHRDWKKGSETLLDTEPITFTVTPTIAVQKRLVAFVAGDGAVNCSFEKDTSAAEKNVEAQLKAIKALGGVFHAVLVQNQDGKYDQVDQSSSAHFTSPIANGPRILSSRAQYLNPNFGAEYNIDERWVMSAQTADSPLSFGPGPNQLNATVESVKLTQAMKDSSNTTATVGEHGCLFTFDAPAANHKVTLRAVFDDANHPDTDSHADIDLALTVTKKFYTHEEIKTSLGLTTHAHYYGQGVTFLVGHKDANNVESLPKALFHMPKGVTTFAAGDFDVKSGAKQLTIMYKVTDEEEIEKDHAGNYEVPATITYKETVTGHKQTLRVADLTSANGIVISGLDDARKYTLSVAVDGQSAALELGDKSPAVSPNAVANLKVEQVANEPTKLTVTFEASKDNGEYDAITPSKKAYVSTMVNGVKRYLFAATGALAAVSAGKVGFTVASGAELSGLTAGAEYDVEIESTFAGSNSNSDQVVSVLKTDVIPCAHPEIKDFRLDVANRKARLIVDLRGAMLINLILMANNGSLLNFDVADFRVAQLTALSKTTQHLALEISVPANAANVAATNVAVVAASSQGAIMAAANAAQGSATIAKSETDYQNVLVWHMI